MPSLNRAFHLGSLTRTPSFRQTARGTPVCTFDLQVDVAERENACVIRIVVWGKQAEPSARHLGAGRVVFIAGHLRQREYVTGEGEKRRMLEVVSERIAFLPEPAGHVREIARVFIDPPAILPDADPPSQLPESDPPSPDE